MKKVLIAVVLSLAFMGSASATGVWVILGQVTLSGPPIGTVATTSAIDSVGQGRFYTEGACRDGIKDLLVAPVLRATSSPQGLFYDSFTSSGGVVTGVPGAEKVFNPLANVTKTVMADCINIGQ